MMSSLLIVKYSKDSTIPLKIFWSIGLSFPSLFQFMDGGIGVLIDSQFSMLNLFKYLDVFLIMVTLKSFKKKKLVLPSRSFELVLNKHTKLFAQTH